MKVIRDTIEIRTEESQQFLDVTKQIQDVVSRSSIRNGTLLIHSLHTTIAVFVNEFQSALLDDLGVLLQKLVPRRDGYFVSRGETIRGASEGPRTANCSRVDSPLRSEEFVPSLLSEEATIHADDSRRYGESRSQGSAARRST